MATMPRLERLVHSAGRMDNALALLAAAEALLKQTLENAESAREKVMETIDAVDNARNNVMDAITILQNAVETEWANEHVQLSS